MRGVADAEQARTGPALQAIDRHRQEFHVVPAFHVRDSRLQDRRHADDGVAESVEPARPHRLILSLRDHIGALPVIAAIEGHHHLAGVEPREQVFTLVGALAGAKPQHIHRRACLLDLETGTLPHDRMPAVAGDGEIGVDFDGAFRCRSLHALDHVARLDQVGRLGIHHHPQRWKSLAALAQEIEKIPLRHEGDEGVSCLEPAEVRDADRSLAELSVHGLQPLMRKFQESVDQAEFIHHLQRRGMHRVAAKIPEEVGVFFQHHDIDPGASKQIAQHHARRATADDAASRGDAARWRWVLRRACVHDFAP